MTTIQTTSSTDRTPADLRHATRIFAAVMIPLGPAFVAALRYLVPYQTSDDSLTAVRAVAENPDRQSIVVWLGFAAMFTLVPGILFVARVARREAPRLTAAGLLLLVPGYTALAMLVAGDAATWYGVTNDLPESVVVDLYEGTHPALLASVGVFILGHVLGTVLLGIALLRTRKVPAVAAWMVIASQPFHFVSAVIIGSHALDLAAWSINAIGFAMVALVVLRMTDDEWEPR